MTKPFFLGGWSFQPRSDAFVYEAYCNVCKREVGGAVRTEEMDRVSLEQVEKLILEMPRNAKENFEYSGCPHTALVPPETWEPSANDLEFLEMLRERRGDVR